MMDRQKEEIRDRQLKKEAQEIIEALEIIEAIMYADEIKLTPKQIAEFVEGFFQEADECNQVSSNRITEIHWKNVEFLDEWRIFCFNGKSVRTVDYEKDDEVILMLILQILSKVNQDTLKEALQKDFWNDNGYTVTVKKTFRSIRRQ